MKNFFRKKLSLKKTEIATLSDAEMRSIQGGFYTQYCGTGMCSYTCPPPPPSVTGTMCGCKI
jgi:natural product precursor